MAPQERKTQDEPAASAGAQSVEMPRPTTWPMVLALGIMLLAAGLLTNLVFSLLGAAMTVTALAGWIGELAPGAGTHQEAIVAEGLRAAPIQASKTKVARLEPGRPSYRARIPERVHPYRAGLKGGAVGGVVMALTALLYGLISGRGIWYPVNLLAAMVLPQFNNATVGNLESFSLPALIAGIGIHAMASLSMGLILAVIMPMLPRGHFIWGSLVAPLLWTGAVNGFMGVLNPVMNVHVDWIWFIVSQFAYGITTVLVILRSEKVEVNHARRARPPGDSTG